MRNAFRIFRRDLKRILRNPAALLVIIGVSIIPSLYAWFNIVANIDPYAKPLKASDPASIMQRLLFRTISVNHC